MLTLSPLLSDGALLQRDRPVAVWGTAQPGSRITVNLERAVRSGCSQEEPYTTTVAARPDGTWETTLPAQSADGGVWTMTVTADGGEDGEAVTVRDIIFGDVWLLAGQSNMELWLGRLTARFPHVLEEADDDLLRVFAVKQTFDFEREHDDLDSGWWIKASKDDFSNVSGVGYFFAQRIRHDIGVPVGLVSTAIGGTRVESWMSRTALESIGMLPDDFDRLTARYVAESDRLAEQRNKQYYQAFDRADRGLAEHWERPGHDDGGWDELRLSEWRRPELRHSGSIWLRKSIDVPQKAVGHRAQLRLGTLIDADDCYVGGELIGGTGYQYPPRNYDIESLPSTLDIAWRIKVYSGNGGLTWGKAHEIVVDPGEGGEYAIDLDRFGPWRFRRGCHMPDTPTAEAFIRECAVGDYNAMIAPLRRLGLTGILWYQGESNCWHAQGYALKQMTLVQSWRELFGDPDLPFIYAQLPNYELEDPSTWVRIREEQRQALAVAHTAMVTTYDVGEANDLHPLDKRSVGDRMAEAAESMVYGSGREPMGPVPSLVWTEDSRIIIRFVHVGSGLRASGPLDFELVGGGIGLPSRMPLTGTIIGRDRIAIELPSGARPDADAQLRFAWEASPKPILTNGDGLLATPFSVAML